MAKKKYSISGQIIDRKSKKGIYKLRVEVWDKEKNLISKAETDPKGNFHIFLGEKYFREYDPERSPDLFFKVYKGKRLVKNTEDSVLWNPRKPAEVAFEIDTPPQQPTGQDRITVNQVLNAVDFVQKSDFNGLLKEAKDRSGATLGFVTDMVVNTFTKMDIKPLKVGTHKTSDIINQDIASARKNLELQEVTINDVRPYKPGLNKESFANIALLPAQLKSGTRVNLYEENGIVRYYSIEKEKAPSSKDLADSIKVQKTEINELKKELKATKQQSEKKDKHIVSLQKEMESLRKEQKKIEKQITPEAIKKINLELQKLKEFKKNMEKSLKKTRKPPPK